MTSRRSTRTGQAKPSAMNIERPSALQCTPRSVGRSRVRVRAAAPPFVSVGIRTTSPLSGTTAKLASHPEIGIVARLPQASPGPVSPSLASV